MKSAPFLALVFFSVARALAEKVSHYSEFGSTGPGAKPAARAAWAKPLTEAEARSLTPQRVLDGTDHWNPDAQRPHLE